MRLPEAVKIGPYVFAVKEADRLQNPDRTSLNGWIRYDACEILLDAAPSDQAKRGVLTHEIVHGVATVAGVEMEEEEVDRFAMILAAVLLDNPDLLEVYR